MQVIKLKAIQKGKRCSKQEKDRRWYYKRYGGRKGARGLSRKILAEYEAIHSRNKS